MVRSLGKGHAKGALSVKGKPDAAYLYTAFRRVGLAEPEKGAS